MKNIKKMKKISIKLTIVPLLMSLCCFKVNNNIKSLKTTEKQRVLKSITDEELPDVDSSTYHSSSSSFGSSIYIDGVPEYYNSPSQFLVYKTVGCSPTAGAMLTSFYDMNCSYFNNLYAPNLPMKHEQDISRVRNAINSIRNFMRTDYDSGSINKKDHYIFYNNENYSFPLLESFKL